MKVYMIPITKKHTLIMHANTKPTEMLSLEQQKGSAFNYKLKGLLLQTETHGPVIPTIGILLSFIYCLRRQWQMPILNSWTPL